MDMHACCCRKRPHNLPPAKCAISIIAQAGLRWRYLPRPPPPHLIPRLPSPPPTPLIPQRKKADCLQTFFENKTQAHFLSFSFIYFLFKAEDGARGGIMRLLHQSRVEGEEKRESSRCSHQGDDYLFICMFVYLRVNICE